MAWRLVVTDLAGTSLGEITNAYQRTFSFALNRSTTASFQVRLDNQFADLFVSLECMVKAYQDDQLVLVGDVTSAEEAGQDQQATVAVVVTDPFARLSARTIGKSKTGYKRDDDMAATALDILNQVNGEWYTGITPGDVESSTRDVVGPWTYKPAAEAITDMSSTLGGPDFRVRPVEPVEGLANGEVGLFDAQAFFGSNKLEAIFEYGIGRRNVQSYTRSVSRETLANVVYCLPSGFPDNSVGSEVSGFDSASEIKWGRKDAVLSSDLTVDFFRQQLVNEHVRVRANPRQIIQFTPIRQDPTAGTVVPRFKEDYDVGDFVTVRLVKDGRLRADVVQRVYGVDMALTDEGEEQPTVTTIPNDG